MSSLGKCNCRYAVGLVVLDRGVEKVPSEVTPTSAARETEGGDGVVVLGAAVDEEADPLDSEFVKYRGRVLPSLVREKAKNACCWSVKTQRRPFANRVRFSW